MKITIDSGEVGSGNDVKMRLFADLFLGIIMYLWIIFVLVGLHVAIITFPGFPQADRDLLEEGQPLQVSQQERVLREIFSSLARDDNVIFLSLISALAIAIALSLSGISSSIERRSKALLFPSERETNFSGVKGYYRNSINAKRELRVSLVYLYGQRALLALVFGSLVVPTVPRLASREIFSSMEGLGGVFFAIILAVYIALELYKVLGLQESRPLIEIRRNDEADVTKKAIRAMIDRGILKSYGGGRLNVRIGRSSQLLFCVAVVFYLISLISLSWPWVYLGEGWERFLMCVTLTVACYLVIIDDYGVGSSIVLALMVLWLTTVFYVAFLDKASGWLLHFDLFNWPSLFINFLLALTLVGVAFLMRIGNKNVVGCFRHLGVLRMLHWYKGEKVLSLTKGGWLRIEYLPFIAASVLFMLPAFLLDPISAIAYFCVIAFLLYPYLCFLRDGFAASRFMLFNLLLAITTIIIAFLPRVVMEIYLSRFDSIDLIRLFVCLLVAAEMCVRIAYLCGRGPFLDPLLAIAVKMRHRRIKKLAPGIKDILSSAPLQKAGKRRIIWPPDRSVSRKYELLSTEGNSHIARFTEREITESIVMNSNCL